MRRRASALAALPLALALLAGCGSGTNDTSGGSSGSTSSTSADGQGHDGMSHDEVPQADLVAAHLGNAAFQDVSQAEAAGYASSLDALGCFQDPKRGGMGVHYVNDTLMDDQLDIAHPEALVYELDAAGDVAGLVAHEYIVPTAAWTGSAPPELSGIPLHRHPTLPLWVLHLWLWKPNPAGMLQDWNPAVRLCPAGVPIFGVDRPRPPAETPSTAATPASTAGDDRSDRIGPH